MYIIKYKHHVIFLFCSTYSHENLFKNWEQSFFFCLSYCHDFLKIPTSLKHILYIVILHSRTTNRFEDTIYLCRHSKKRVDIESIYIQYVQFAKCHISHLYKIAVVVTTLSNRYERKKGFFKSLIQMRRKMFALTKT